MAATWPSLPLFECVTFVPLTTHLTGTSRARLLCLEMSTTAHTMSPPPDRFGSKADSHVYRIETCHRFWRDRRLGAASHAARTSPESSAEKDSLTNKLLIDSIASWNGADDPADLETTTTYYERQVVSSRT